MFDVFSCFFHIPPRTTWQVQWRWTRHSHRSSDSLAFAMHLLCICYMSSHIDFEYAKSATVLIDFQEWLFEQGHVWPGGSWLRRHVHIRFDGTSLRLFSNCDERVEGSNWRSAPNCINFIQDRYWKPDLTEEEARKWSRPLTANTLASNLSRQFGSCLES